MHMILEAAARSTFGVEAAALLIVDCLSDSDSDGTRFGYNRLGSD